MEMEIYTDICIKEVLDACSKSLRVPLYPDFEQAARWTTSEQGFWNEIAFNAYKKFNNIKSCDVKKW
jgi:hypothetical protein